MTNPNPPTLTELAAQVDALTAQLAALHEAVDTFASAYLEDRRRSGPRTERSRTQDARIRNKVRAAHPTPPGGPPAEPGGAGAQGALRR